MKYGTQFSTATEEEVRRLLKLVDDDLIHAWQWITEWVLSDVHPAINDPRAGHSSTTTPDAVLAYFEESADRQRKTMKRTGS